MDWFGDLDATWLWLILGLVLAAVEMIAPGYFLIWMAAAAFMTGLVTAVVDVELPIQILSFVVFSAFSVFAARRWFDYAGISTTDPLMNDKGARLVGTRVVVTQAIDGGEGRVRLGDSEWLARGVDADVGTRLVVTGHDGAVLLVGPVPATHLPAETKSITQD
ncbi:NfeD family protein [Croceicoccus pelagius]|uniref:Membrane protein n=1 Tax=Croceicoccus pelagius TaxID=1703341 RepID=A0A917DJ39_9SPHN|nr:NfeD family protein [Croceicoccus pelagius]GGD40476.1 membrane protein [Croceicoccus pelagius]